MQRKLILSFCLTFFSVIIHSSELNAAMLDFGWSASGNVGVTVGSDSEQLKMDVGELGVELTDSIFLQSSEAFARAAYSLSGGGLAMRAELDIEAFGEVETEPNTFFGSSASARAIVRWFDSISITGDEPLSQDKILLNWQIDGSFQGTVDQSGLYSGSSGTADFDVPTSDDPILGGALYGIQWNDGVLSTDGVPNISKMVTFSQTLNQLEPTPVEAIFQLDASASGGTMSARFGNTITLHSITFEDGSTPESRGFAVSFASGINSPNAIPEPSSAILSVLLAGCCLTSRFRRKASCEWERRVTS